MANSEELYDAIEADDADTISQLLTRQPGLVNSVEETPPPIHWAIYRDKRRAVEALLDRGADLALQDRDRDATPLDYAEYAVVYARRESIRMPIARGASLDSAMAVALEGVSGGFDEFEELPVGNSMKRLSGCSANSTRRNPPTPKTCHNSPTRLIVAPRFTADGQSAFPALPLRAESPV